MGIAYEGSEQRAMGISQGNILILEREYANQYDPNAIIVRYNGDEVGHLERSIARLIAPAMDTGTEFQATAETVQRSPVLTVNVGVVRTG